MSDAKSRSLRFRELSIDEFKRRNGHSNHNAFVEWCGLRGDQSWGLGLCSVGARIRLIGLHRPGKHKPSWGAPHYTTAVVKQLIYLHELSREFVRFNDPTKEFGYYDFVFSDTWYKYTLIVLFLHVMMNGKFIYFKILFIIKHSIFKAKY